MTEPLEAICEGATGYDADKAPITRAEAEHRWFHGLAPGSQPAGSDVGEAFRAGWNARNPAFNTLQERLALAERVLEAAQAWKVSVHDAMRHQAACEDSPCEPCEQTALAEDVAAGGLISALKRLDDETTPPTVPREAAGHD